MIRRALVAALLAMVMSMLGIGVAQAHSALIGSDPAADAVVGSTPAAITLTFNQDINPKFAKVTVTDADGRNWADEPIVTEAVVRADITTELAATTYTVSYRVVSQDGHPISGTYRFTYAPETPGAPRATAAPPSAPPVAAENTGSSTTTRTVLIVALMALVIGSMAVVLFATRRGKH